MIKKSLMVFIVLSIFLILSAVTVYGSEILIYIDGEKLETDQPPIVQNGRTLVPLRAIGEGLGGKVSWDNSTKTARISYTNVNGVSCSVDFYIDQTDYKGYYYYLKATNTFERFSIDVKPQLINGYTYLPLRACAEALDCDVDWSEITNTINITKLKDISNFKTTSTFTATSLEELYARIDATDPNAVTTAYSQLTSDEKDFFDLFSNQVTIFKSPATVKLIKIGGTTNNWDIELMASNGYGAVTSGYYNLKEGTLSKIPNGATSIIVLQNYDSTSTLRISYLNKALDEYYSNMGWS